jgi:transposase
MNAKIVHDELTKQRVLADMRDGLSSYKAGAAHGVSQSTALKWAKAEGITLASKRKLDPEAREALRQDVRNNVLDVASLVEKHGVSKVYVYSLIRCWKRDGSFDNVGR